jgi:hypothetical protein
MREPPGVHRLLKLRKRSKQQPAERKVGHVRNVQRKPGESHLALAGEGRIMAIGDEVGSKAAKTIADALPGVEAAVDRTMDGLRDLVVNTLTPAFADFVSQGEMQIDRLDGATVTLEPSGKLTVSVTVDIPSFKATISAPLRARLK